MDLVPRSNLWLERDGQVVLSRWRVALLEAIAQTGSISAAAERLDIDYHRAWDRVQQMEQRLGVPLIERQTGGPGGGGARLTEAGREYVARFNRFAQGIDEFIALHYQEAFGPE
jgi:molybdate transport system regulatory protein